jgi:hypothetical protein
VKLELRAMTNNHLNRESAVVISSTMPSAQLHAAAIDQFTREFNDGATSALVAVSTAAARMKGSAESRMSQPRPSRRPARRRPPRRNSELAHSASGLAV